MSVRAPRFGKCPTCGRTIALVRVSDTGYTRNHMPPPHLRDGDHAVRSPSGAWYCKGGRTPVLRQT